MEAYLVTKVIAELYGKRA